MSSVCLESCSSFKTRALEVFPHLVSLFFCFNVHTYGSTVTGIQMGSQLEVGRKENMSLLVGRQAMREAG